MSTYRNSLSTAALAVALAFVGAGCNQTGITTGSDSSQVAVNENGVSIVPASSAQCPDGGVVVESFIDLQHDGTLDSGDPILSSTPVCDGANGMNGTNGQNGLGSGIQVTQATANQCPAGGFQFMTFQDPSNSGVYEQGDTITSTNTICNGVDGTNGQNGTNGNSFSFSQQAASANQCPAGGVVYTVQEYDGNGQAVAGSSSTSVVCNGTNAVFTTVAASSEQCPNGGNVLLMASDTAGTGVYESTDANQESVLICDGAQGAQGEAGPVSPFSAVAPITPCGPNSSPYKEVLLCLDDGNILADFSADADGEDTRLSFIPAGSYEDTDSSGCIFNVAANNAGGFTVSWSAGSNQYGTWGAGSYACAAASSN